MKKFNSLKDSVFFSGGKIKSVFHHINWEKYEQIFVLVDENSQKHCLPLIKNELPKNCEIIQIKSGEKNKNLASCETIWHIFEKKNAGRNSLLINLGGGQICDIGGFAASIYKRGIPFIHIPTTLIAQADSCIGGKTGLNFMHYKNHLGVFSEPVAVFIHLNFLLSLSNRERISGLAEIAKHALLKDETLWNLLCDRKFSSEQFSDENLIKRSLEIKNKIVKSDYKERGDRKLLNFGHTIGHALESLMMSKQKQILHGEAVAAGIIVESYLSFKLNKLSESELNQITTFVCTHFNLPKISNTEIPSLFLFMKADKKNDKGKINFSLLKKIGKAEINFTPSEHDIKEAITYYSEGIDL